jgi:hypothetical protein
MSVDTFKDALDVTKAEPNDDENSFSFVINSVSGTRVLFRHLTYIPLRGRHRAGEHDRSCNATIF